MGNLPLSLPPGFYRNGVDYSTKGRWKGGSLVRFVDNKVRAIGGWARRLDVDENEIDAIFADPDLEAARGIFGWRDNLGARYVAIGTTLKLLILDSSGGITDITPLGATFVPGTKDSDVETGYGVGEYGRQAYGRARSGEGLVSTPVGTWRFDAWGQDLLAAGPMGDATRLHYYTPGSAPGTLAVVVANSPTGFNDFLVTDQRIVMCIGTGDNQRGVSWSASEDRTLWTPAATNQAGGRTLAGYGALLSCVRVATDILIVGEKDAHVARYIGPPYVYSINRAGDDCGCVNAASVVATDTFAMWFSGRDFYKYDGTVKPVPCEVGDYLISDMIYSQRSKMFGFANGDYSELTWLYESIFSDGDCDSYVSYDYLRQHWTTGRLARTVAMDKGVTRDNVMISPDGFIYNHELPGTLTGDETPYVITGPIEIGDGDQIAYLDSLIAAEVGSASTDVYIHARDFPNSSIRTTGPFTTRATHTPIRGYGRQIEIELQGNGSAAWLLGDFRVNLKAGGKK